MLFAEEDAPRVPREAIDAAVTPVLVSRGPNGFQLRLRGQDIDGLSVDICAAIALSEQGENTLREYIAHHGVNGADGDTLTQIARAHGRSNMSLAVASEVQNGLGALVREMSGRNASLARALAALRREHEVLQDAFATMEEAVAALNLPEKPAFTMQPTDRVLSFGDGWGAADTLHQRIPVSSRAVSSVDICLFIHEEVTHGEFRVALHSLEDDLEVGSWRIPFEGIAGGWVNLQLDQGLSGNPRTLELRISAHADGGEAPGLLLAAPSALEDAVYRTSSGKRGDCPLAFRVWRSLPGVRRKPLVHSIQSTSSEGRSSIRHLGPEQLASAQALGSAARTSPSLVQYIQDVGELQVHPATQELVCAYLERAIPPFARRVSVNVITRHPEADIVDYAILAVPGRSAVEHVLAKLAKADGPINAFSGWKPVPAMEQSQLSLEFTEPPRVAQDLILLTRAHEKPAQGPDNVGWRRILKRGPDRGHTRYAWARFFGIEVELAQQ